MAIRSIKQLQGGNLTLQWGEAKDDATKTMQIVKADGGLLDVISATDTTFIGVTQGAGNDGDMIPFLEVDPNTEIVIDIDPAAQATPERYHNYGITIDANGQFSLNPDDDTHDILKYMGSVTVVEGGARVTRAICRFPLIAGNEGFIAEGAT